MHSYKEYKEIFGIPELPLALKIHVIEEDISQLVYGIWCRITGGKFERRKAEGQKVCYLVTKRGFHPLSNFLAKRKNREITPTYLEIYERNCPGNREKGVWTMFWYGKQSNFDKCRNCGKSFAVQEDDVKIVGKF